MINIRAVQLITENRCLRSTNNFLVIFRIMLGADHVGPRTSDLSIESRRRNDFTAAPFLSLYCEALL